MDGEDEGVKTANRTHGATVNNNVIVHGPNLYGDSLPIRAHRVWVKNMFEKSTERDLICFPIVFNVVGLFAIGTLYAVSPEHLAKPEELNTVLNLGVFITQWSLAYVIVRRLGIRGVRELIVPKKKFRWLPSILVFISLNVLFTTYMVLALRYGRISPWGNLNPLQLVFFTVLNPITAGFIEELIWRGYFIEKLLAIGKTEWKAIVFSSASLQEHIMLGSEICLS